MEYYIREEKFESVSKKINSIKNKCEKLGLPFKFDILGEEFRNIGSDRRQTGTSFGKSTMMLKSPKGTIIAVASVNIVTVIASARKF